MKGSRYCIFYVAQHGIHPFDSGHFVKYYAQIAYQASADSTHK